MNRKPAIYGKTKLKGLILYSSLIAPYMLILLNILIIGEVKAISKKSVSSGNWNSPTCWIPSGKPSSNDDVTILATHTITVNNNEQVKNLTISESGKYLGSINKSINISGNLVVNGILDMNGGNINLLNSGSEFNLGSNAVFTWSPGNNTSLGATLLTNGLENFNSTSTLIIKRWYDYSKPLGEVVSGNFGNLVINTPGGTNSIVEWNQKNKFQTHLIKGTLTVDQGWLTLDKTGSISSTNIGNIILTSVNSTLIAHTGNHPSAFTISTSSVTNNNGNLYGLSDGNGNINMIVFGNFINSGNIKVINNTGVSGVSNGNAILRVDGDFIQTNGDTRIIYNVATTNSGTFSATIKNLILSGGIFIGQSACHTGGRLNLINITQDLLINFQNATDKFRGTGITSIGQTINNVGLALNIGRDLIINGITEAEFTTSASSGDELVSVHRNMTIQGCTSNFNYGTSQASNSTELFVQGNLSILGGICYLSKNNGALHSVVSNNLYVKNGELIIKGNSGPASLVINGTFNQTGGNFVFHSNPTTQSNDIVKAQINGSFIHSGGIINFDDNATGTEHILSLSGDSCLISGNGIITRTGTSNSNDYGKINFEKEGIIFYQKTGSNHLIDHVAQSINQNCELVINNTNLQLASFLSDSIYAFIISSGGKLTLNNSTLFSNGHFSKCNLKLDSSALISLTNENGFATKEGSAISENVNYFLDQKSVVEYRGEKTQIVTGISWPRNATSNKYGILRIVGNNSNYTASIDDKVYIRTKLELVSGKLKLNNRTLTIENGKKDAILRVNGFVDCNINQTSPLSNICWKNMNSGIHEFPFGLTTSNYLPVKFNLLNGTGNDVNISTYRTDKNNISSPTGSGLLTSNIPFEESIAVERCWSILANGTKSDITFTYANDENILNTELTKTTCSINAWSGSNWIIHSPSGNTGNKNNSTISILNISDGKQFIIVSKNNNPQFELKDFAATCNENEVKLSWETINEENSLFYKIEKSTDGINFYEIGAIEPQNNPNIFSNYNFSDKELPIEISYYRLKFTNSNKTSYSKIKLVTSDLDFGTEVLKINSVSPNPFISSIRIEYKAIDKSAIIEIINAEGRKIYNGLAESLNREDGNAILNLEHLKKGVYFLSLINKGKKDTVKIIKND